MLPMGNFTPADIPAFLDPLLEYIRSVIPPPLYSFLLTFLSHALALLTSLSALILSLISTKPWEWGAQTVLPPLISLLAAYLALISLYRTTTWMIRSSVWFVKWGTIIGVLIAGAGWLVGTTNGLGLPGASQFISDWSGNILDIINGQERNTARRSRRKSQARARGSRAKSSPRPKPWESFERHQEWAAGSGGGDSDVRKIIADIASAAGQAMRESGWWEVAKSVVDGSGTNAHDASKGPRKGKTREGNSRSR